MRSALGYWARSARAGAVVTHFFRDGRAVCDVRYTPGKPTSRAARCKRCAGQIARETAAHVKRERVRT